MRIFVHDFGAFPFPFELCAWLAGQGHDVLYGYFSDRTQVRSGLHIPEELRSRLTLREIQMEKYDKYNFVAKGMNDLRYGRMLTELALGFRPDVVMSGQTPLDSQAVLARACKKNGIRFVYWLQDLIAVGIRVALDKRGFPLRRLISKRYERLEEKILAQSDAIVAASEAFIPALEAWNVWHGKSVVINNWCPLGDITPLPQSNAWSIENGLGGLPCVIYSGSLGLKHDPEYFLTVARAIERYNGVLVMISEGPGVTWLREVSARDHIDNIHFLPFQPYDRLSEVLATASILLATNSAAASQFCFPSKVLTYMCAGRAILLSAPLNSYIAGILERSGAGIVVDPADAAALEGALSTLLGKAEDRERFGAQARANAVNSFDIETIGRKFLTVLESKRGVEEPLVANMR